MLWQTFRAVQSLYPSSDVNGEVDLHSIQIKTILQIFSASYTKWHDSR
jgi:hypothetical protein